ncbi:hypothetical protein GGX14DRAFT_588470 [Mycena pura]|uniref:Uncharacterized protein n=1 Tax=Mycena pura TaxID=153505 RepID=A0AAD6Y6H0_9AGAR|nr:hypothetical protein GGX14DRAFT_588470 [Mycena pura]
MSSSSYFSISGFAILDSPRKVTSSGKTIVFDAQFYLGGSKGRESIQASLRYFNAADDQFPDVGVYSVYATVAQVDPAVQVFSETPDDFSLVGDITKLTHHGSPDDVHFDFAEHPMVHLSGPATNVKVDEATFVIEGEQYTSAHQELQKNANANKDKQKEGSQKDACPKPSFQALCSIPDSQRWSSGKKPLPWNKRFGFIMGTPFDVTSELNGNTKQVKESLHIKVEHITFLGTHVPTADSSSPAAGTATPVKRQSKWNFGDRTGSAKRSKSTGIASSDDISAGPSSPSPFR